MSNPQDDDEEIIRIVSLRDERQFGTACLIGWRGTEWYASTAYVRQTAHDLMLSATVASLGATLAADLGLEHDVTASLLGSLLSKQGVKQLGSKHTFLLTPGVDTKRGVGAVQIKRGTNHTNISADVAREMAGHWMESAEASESDTIVHRLLQNGGMDSETLNQLFLAMQAVRTGKIKLPPPLEKPEK